MLSSMNALNGLSETESPIRSETIFTKSITAGDRERFTQLMDTSDEAVDPEVSALSLALLPTVVIGKRQAIKEKQDIRSTNPEQQIAMVRQIEDLSRVIEQCLVHTEQFDERVHRLKLYVATTDGTTPLRIEITHGPGNYRVSLVTEHAELKAELARNIPGLEARLHRTSLLPITIQCGKATTISKRNTKIKDEKPCIQIF